MTDPAEELDGILLERHPSPAAEAEPATSEGRADVGSGDHDPCWQSLKSRQQSRAMRLTSSQPTQHVKILPQHRRGSGQAISR
jgi:hypothetical protein